MTNALIFSTDRKLAFELIALAKNHGLTPVVAALGEKVENPQEFVQRGASKVLVVESPNLKDFRPEAVSSALEAARKETDAKYVLVNGTRRGKEIAPYFAARIGAAAITLAQKVEGQGGDLKFDRLYLGGKTLATEVPQTDVTVATVATKLTEPLPADAGAQGDVQTLNVDVPASKVKVVERKPRPDTGVDLEGATVVIGAGRGFKNKDDLKLAFDLAKTVGGQVGCTRPLATDLGWLTDEYWIGLSGKEVKPKLYVAAGISGQIQHTTGIRGSKIIVAINNNKDAPIFKVADYGIVGDLYKVLPALQSAIQKETS